MHLNIVIVDDERDAVNSVKLMLKEYCADFTIVGEAFTIIDAIKEIQHKKPNLVFLDIEMPHGTGFDILESIPDRTFEVIFVTAYNDYAIKAIKSAATDYLLKPLDIEELVQAISNVRQKLINKNSGISGKLKSDEALTGQMQSKIAINTSEGVEFINTADIIRIEADGSYSCIFLNNCKKIVCSRNLKEFQEILNKDIFYRAHNSHLINLLLVKRFVRGEGVIEMQDGSTVTLSRRNKDEFIQRMEKWTNL